MLYCLLLLLWFTFAQSVSNIDIAIIAELQLLNTSVHVRQSNRPPICNEEVGNKLEKHRMKRYCSIYDQIPILPHMNASDSCSTLIMTEVLENVFSSSNTQYFKQFAESYDQRNCINESMHNKFAILSRHAHRDIILTMAEGYNCHVIEIFLNSLRLTRSMAEVYLFRSDAHNFSCPLLSKYQPISIEPISDFPAVGLEVRRYVLALNWIIKNVPEVDEDRTNIVIVDFHDILFQRDPFIYFEFVGSPLVFGDEGYPHQSQHVRKGNVPRQTIGNDPTGATLRWIECPAKAILGSNLACFMNQVRGSPILNSGFIIGKAFALKNLLYTFSFTLNSIDMSEPYLAGQGILNYIYYKGLLQNSGAKVLPIAASFFVHMESYLADLSKPSEPYDLLTNPFVNVLGVPYAVVHQTNRLHVSNIVDSWKQSQKLLYGVS